MSHNGNGVVGAVDATTETARSSLAPSSDATALNGSAQVVSTPVNELPQPLFNMATDTNGEGSSSSLTAEGGAMSRSPSMSSKRKTAAQQQRGLANAAAGYLHDPICFPTSFTETGAAQRESKMVLELADGTAFQGFSFGAKGKSISGECVFQTGKSPFLQACSSPILPRTR